ncbi:MAG: hypothetical protein ACE5HY_00815 [Candidatus Hydrothermarchaeales archaeon]
MDKGEIREELERIKGEVEVRGPLDPKFWSIVKEVKLQRILVEEFASIIGEIDQLAFENKVRLKVDHRLGLVILIVWATIAVLPLLSYSGPSARTGILLIFTSIFLTTLLHDPAHYLVGRLMGIRFTYMFPDGPVKIEPSLKTDYATYLRIPPLKRMIFHFSGPLTTSFLVPIAFLTMAFILDVPPFARYVLAGMLFMDIASEFTPIVLTEYLKKSNLLGMNFRRADYARALREWRIARTWT